MTKQTTSNCWVQSYNPSSHISLYSARSSGQGEVQPIDIFKIVHIYNGLDSLGGPKFPDLVTYLKILLY